MLIAQTKRRRAVPGEAMKSEEILSELRQMGDRRRVAGLRRAGVTSPAFGVALPALRSLAGRIGQDHRLASELWREAVREARILASLIDEPECVTETQMDQWAEAFDSWEICDQCCQNLFWRTRFALAKGLEWTQRPEEFVKRAGFVLVAVLAVPGRQAEDSTFVDPLATLIAAADDERAYVQKGASWALRQIGKRNGRLRERVLTAVASEIVSDSGASRWVARDVSRELRLTRSPQS
jgi:3-methyladenine DNA glycosylase AlkD